MSEVSEILKKWIEKADHDLGITQKNGLKYIIS